MILPPENRFVKGVTSKTDSNFAKKTAWLIETERKSFAEAPNTGFAAFSI